MHHSYKLPLFGHGPGHVFMYIAAGLDAAATGLFLACITRNLRQGPVSVQLLGTARERFRTYNEEYKHGKWFEAFEPFVMFVFLHRLKIK